VPQRHATPSAASDEIAQLRDEVTDLKNQVRALSDILEEIRVDLQWVTQNGLPIRESLSPCPTLKRMALDPCADDWGDQLVIEYGPRRTSDEMRRNVVNAPDSSNSRPPVGKLFAIPGDQKRLF
jgi:hypothetical protein